MSDRNESASSGAADGTPIGAPAAFAEPEAAAAARREALRKIGAFSAYAAPAILFVASAKAIAGT